MRLKDRIAIITGAGSGLGRSSAQLFAKEGAKVVVADIIAKDGEETVRMIREAGGDAIFVQTDVSKATEAEKMVRAAIDNYGKLDILFNNAGIPVPQGKIADQPEETWDRIMAVNLKGPFLCSKYAIPEMLKGGGGVILNTSSAAGVMSAPMLVPYCISKAGVIMLTKGTASEYSHEKIRVNCICPGGIDTPFLDKSVEADPDALAEFKKQLIRRGAIGRLAKAEEIAQAALFLVSDEASYVTRASVAVDGGFTT